jgi:hypothetical protein
MASRPIRTGQSGAGRAGSSGGGASDIAAPIFSCCRFLRQRGKSGVDFPVPLLGHFGLARVGVCGPIVHHRTNGHFGHCPLFVRRVTGDGHDGVFPMHRAEFNADAVVNGTLNADAVEVLHTQAPRAN